MRGQIPSAPQPKKVEATPYGVAPGNVLAVIGWTWRYTRDFAGAHGVMILRPAGKPIIRYADLVAAIERVAAAEQPPAPVTEEEELAGARRALAAELAR